jgi:hypothetical protein
MAISDTTTSHGIKRLHTGERFPAFDRALPFWTLWDAHVCHRHSNAVYLVQRDMFYLLLLEKFCKARAVIHWLLPEDLA